MLREAERTVVEAARLWRLSREDPPAFLERLSGIARARWLFRGVPLGTRVCATGVVTVVARGELRIGKRVTFVGGMVPTRLEVRPGAQLWIGDGTVFNYGSSIEARRSIRIGARCLVASFVRIADQREGLVAPIRIGDDVWVAHGATLYPGVSLGDGAVVAAGSVVTRDVPEGSLAVGNPARIMALREEGPEGLG